MGRDRSSEKKGTSLTYQAVKRDGGRSVLSNLEVSVNGAFTIKLN